MIAYIVISLLTPAALVVALFALDPGRNSRPVKPAKVADRPSAMAEANSPGGAQLLR